jgi:hypothetical protein
VALTYHHKRAFEEYMIHPRIFAAALTVSGSSVKNRFFAHNATLTRLMSTGTSKRGPITAANAENSDGYCYG